MSSIEPTQTAQDDWCELLRPMQADAEVSQRECTPGYYNNEGGKEFRYFLGEVYAPGPYSFWEMLEDWRENKDMQGLMFQP